MSGCYRRDKADRNCRAVNRSNLLVLTVVLIGIVVLLAVIFRDRIMDWKLFDIIDGSIGDAIQ